MEEERWENRYKHRNKGIKNNKKKQKYKISLKM
jgi:hypothetical protein